MTRGAALRAAASVGLLALVLATVDAGEAAARLTAADPAWIVAALAALTAQTAVSAARWRLTAGRLGIRLTFGRALSEYYLAQAANQLLPGGVLGDLGRAARASPVAGGGRAGAVRAGAVRAGAVRAGASVALERLAGQTGLGVLGLVLFAVSLAPAQGVAWTGWAAALAIGFGAAPLVLLAAPALLARLSLGGPVARMARLAVFAPVVRRRQATLALTAAALNIAAFVFCARATGADASLAALAAITPLVLGAMLIPASVAGWGLREGAAAMLWPLIGGAPVAGAAAGVAFGLAFLAASLGGVGAMALAAAARGGAAKGGAARPAPGPTELD